MAGAKQNAVGEWAFGKHARRPPWWQEEICRRRPPPADQVALRPGSRFPNSSANALKRNAGGHAGVSNKVYVDTKISAETLAAARIREELLQCLVLVCLLHGILRPREQAVCLCVPPPSDASCLFSCLVAELQIAACVLNEVPFSLVGSGARE